MMANGTAHNSRLRGDLCAPSKKTIWETCRVSSRTRPVAPAPPVIPEAAAALHKNPVFGAGCTKAPKSSGFSTSRFVRWFDHKYGVPRQEHDWVEVHLMCGVRTNVVTAVEIRDRTEKHQWVIW
jgi:hypothetical protein